MFNCSPQGGRQKIGLGYLEAMDEPSWQLARFQLCQIVTVLLEVTLPSRPWHPTVGTKEARDTNTVLGRLFKVCPSNEALVTSNILEMLLCVLTQYHSLA